MAITIDDIDTGGTSAAPPPRRRSRLGSLLRGVVAAVAAVGLVVAGLFVWEEMMGTEQLEASAPTETQLQEFAGVRVFFGHQSVGDNILAGLRAFDDTSATNLRIIDGAPSAEATGGFVAEFHAGINGDPQSKIDAFAAALAASPAGAFDVALLKFCYVDVTANTDVRTVVETYMAAIADLQRQYPDITFLYATVPLTTGRDLKRTIKSWIGRDEGNGPEDNRIRQVFNATLRDRLAGTGLLFDIAAVQAAVDQSTTTVRGEGDGRYYVMHDAYASDPGHLNALGSSAAATEFIRVVIGAAERG